MRRLVLLIALWAGTAQAQGFDALGQGDMLQLKVFGQPELSDVFEIGAGGTVVVPGLGSLTGIRTLGQARAEVRALIDRNFGLTGTSFALTVAGYRPVVVGGDVASPGEVPFRVGLRVAHAVALAKGPGLGGDLSRRIQINEQAEKLAQADNRLARALVREARLMAEWNAEPLAALPDEVATLLPPAAAETLLAFERDLLANRAETTELALRRIGASLEISDDTIAAQQAILKSQSRQLELVRVNLNDLEPLFDQGIITAARILELRRDFVDIEGRVGEAGATLAQARTQRAVLDEDDSAVQLQIRLDLLTELLAVQSDIADARVTRAAVSDSLDAAGELTAGQRARPGDCTLRVLREGPEGAPMVAEADPLTRLMPGDFLQVGRRTPDCPGLLTLGDAQ